MQSAVYTAHIILYKGVTFLLMQIYIIKCLPAIALCLWFMQLHAKTGNRDELVFLFLFIYILFRFTFHKDLFLNTLLIL